MSLLSLASARYLLQHRVQCLLAVAGIALGVAIGITLGVYRLVAGDAIHHYIIGGYIIVMLQTAIAPRTIIPLAYDSGGVTTSTVDVHMQTTASMTPLRSLASESATDVSRFSQGQPTEPSLVGGA